LLRNKVDKWYRSVNIDNRNAHVSSEMYLMGKQLRDAGADPGFCKGVRRQGIWEPKVQMRRPERSR